MATKLKPLSDAIIEPLNKAYKAGGFGLTILSLGSFLMLLAFFQAEKGMLSYIFLFVGLIMVLLPALYFFLKEVRPLMRAQNSIKQKKELIDTVQRTAIEMTELASDLQSLAFKHANQIAGFIQVVRPQLKKIPFASKLAENEVIMKSEAMSSTIVETTLKAKGIIKDVETALTKSDPDSLKKYLNDLQELRLGVGQVLKTGLGENDKTDL